MKHIRNIEKHQSELETENRELKERLKQYESGAKSGLGESLMQYSKSLMLSLIDSLPLNIYCKDADGRFIFVNKSYCLNNQLEAGEIIGKTDFDIHPPELAEKYIKDDMKVMNTGMNMAFDEKHQTSGKKSTYVHVLKAPFYDENNQIIGTIGIFYDISERKKIEEKIRESETKYRQLFDYAPAGIFEADIVKGKLISVNEVMCDYTEYTEDELLQMDPLSLFSEESRKIFQEQVDKSLAGEKTLETAEYQIEGKNGRKFWALLNTRYTYRDGVLFRANVVVHDITEQKKAEEEKKRLQSQLLQAKKLEAIGTLAGGVAHDFNNLLMGIQGRASLMLSNIDSSHPHSRHLRGIEDHVKSASMLTDQLLGFARGGKYEVRPTDLNNLVKKTTEMFGRTKKEISIHEKYQKGIWTTEVDRIQIEQVLLNIYVNAWHAMPSGGDFYITTENFSIDENQNWLYSVPSGRYVKISITDTGMGMDRKTKERIFDPFFTTKEMGRGTGLGLASAYGIVTNHGGIINVYSEIGKGSTFNIYLPASDKKLIDEQLKPKKIVRGTETIMLVDDEELIIDVGKEMILNLGYNVITASGGEEAINTYRENQEQIDIVVLDMVMPKMDGGKVFDELKIINPGVKVILSSGYSINGDATEILNRGCDGFIQKPFSLERFSVKIREVLDKK